MDAEREAARNIVPHEPVTDENSGPLGVAEAVDPPNHVDARDPDKYAGSILPDDVEARRVAHVLRELSGLDAREAQRVRAVLDGAVDDAWWPKMRSAMAMLVRSVHIARAGQWDSNNITNRLHVDLDAAHRELADATAALAISRKEFAAEVQKSQSLERRLALANESAMATIGTLVEELRKR